MATLPGLSGLSGYIPALPTPFNDVDDVDLAAFERLCHRLIDCGASALLVCGTTGEAPNLTHDEHDQIVRIAVSAARGKATVIAGIGSNATEQAIALSKEAAAAGAEAVLAVVPYYNKPTQAGMYAHFCAIADATDLPILLHDVPARTVCALTDDTVARLAERPQFIGLLDSSSDVSRPLRLRRILDPEFRLLTGDDATALAFFAHGGDGCVSSLVNLAPGLCRAMYLAWTERHVMRARQLATAAGTIAAALARESDPAPLKYALSTMGVMSPRVRLPLVEPTRDTRAVLDAVLAQASATHPGYLIGDDTLPARRHVRIPGGIRQRRRAMVAT